VKKKGKSGEAYNTNKQTIYRVAQKKIPHRTIYNISATSGLLLKILEAA